ncbi:adenosine deaminase [Corynebacterium alimapuense]|uniref:adenosine deaminase n=2 Tax=Corynebacterium alimapuense TaxID=1576874 RepID=A0A3M8K751_9CORY|nr:adenosine deaminase [Corynebacterium alimapuense]
MHDTPAISPEHKALTHDLLKQLPKVLILDDLEASLTGELGANLSELNTPDAIAAGIAQSVADLAADNVVYAELRFSPELHTDGGLTLQEAVDCAITGVEAAHRAHPNVDTRLILNASRAGGVLDDVAALAVSMSGPIIVGFSVSGDQERHSLAPHAEAFRALRENYVAFSIQSGLDAGIESVGEAIQLGATRLGNAPRLVDDFGVDMEGIVPGKISAWVRDRHLTVETAPSVEAQRGAAEQLGDHPLPLLQQLGFTCTVNTGDRSVTSLTEQFLALTETFGYGPEEFFDLTVNAVEAAFLNQEQRQHLLETVILPAYEELADPVEE